MRGNWSALRNSPVFSAESWALGCLIYAVHAGTLNSPEELRNIQILPKALHEFYQQLLASNPEQRVPCADLPQQEYFKKGRFVELNLFLDNLAIKDSFEKEAFLKKLPGKYFPLLSAIPVCVAFLLATRNYLSRHQITANKSLRPSPCR